MKHAFHGVAPFLALGMLLTACGDPEWVGSYTTTGHWNLSGPLADGRSASDAVIDLLIAEVADKTPLPFGTADDLAVGLDGLVRPTLRALIDEELAPELRADGSTTLALRSALADVTVTSTLELEEGGDGVEGKETFTNFEMAIASGVHRVTGEQLNPDGVVAEWNGEVEDEEFVLEPHEVPLGFGGLVLSLAEVVVAGAGLETQKNSVLAALECSTLVNALLNGKPALEVDVGLVNVDISAGTLTDACQVLRDIVGREALGLFPYQSLVELGGSVKYSGGDDGGKVTLRHGDGYGGLLKVVPDAIAPKIYVAFEAQQQ